MPRAAARRALLLVSLALAWMALPAVAAAAVSKGFQRLLDAVVRIDVREVSYDDGTRRFQAGVGSGVILSPDGLILTNAHVASPDAVELSITLANLERVGARLVGWDHWTDLAVLQLDLAEVRKRGLKFTHAQFGDSEKLSPGETVFAVGTPHGLTRTVTRGIISNPRRFFADNRGVRGYETGLFNTWLQTDAAINPGNSGGPLVTEDGRVIGINSRGYLGADNLAFAIPAVIARRVMDGLVRESAVTRSYVGVVFGALQDLENFYALQANQGVLINSVDVGSPAAKAGLRPGDIVLTLDGRPIDGRFPEQLPPIQNAIASRLVGTPVKFSIKRGETLREVAIVTEKLESRVGEEWGSEIWGVGVRKVSRAYARENQFDDADGFIVLGVQSGRPAAEAGLRRGDVIRKIGDRELTSLAVLKEAAAAYEAKPEAVLVEIVRDRRASLFVLKP